MKHVGLFITIVVIFFSCKEEKKSRLDFEMLGVSEKTLDTAYRFSFKESTDNQNIKLDTFNQSEIEKRKKADGNRRIKYP